MVAELRAVEDDNKNAAVARAKELGLPIRRELPDGGLEELGGVDEQGQLLYRITHNDKAAISTGAMQLRFGPYNLTGTNLLVGVWDGGSVRDTHQEMTGRVTRINAASLSRHATHVAGTIIASGVDRYAQGMASGARMRSYDWNNDLSEMAAAGAAAASHTNSMLVSNHSYGIVSGWRYRNGGSPYRRWEWWGDGTSSAASDHDFGRYDTSARDTDSVALTEPFMTIFWSAGNDRTDTPRNGDAVVLDPSAATVTAVAYDSSTHPAGDGAYRGGYETISFNQLAKNVVTIGAVDDAVFEGQNFRYVANATMSSFSSWGPTDDGRIKPDLVANGEWVYSCGEVNDTDYYVTSGTSMASPNAAGTAVLVAQEYIRLFGQNMRSSTMRGLLIHTADDLGLPGPDYSNGWGLVNGQGAVDLIRDDAAKPNRARLTENLITSTSSTVTHSFVWDGVSPIKVTICWTDPAGTATTTSDSRTPVLVNNLDLRVVGPDGVTTRPYTMPFVGTWTQASMSLPATTGINNTDNVEQVNIASPAVKGTYQAVVTYQGALSGNQQHFAMLVSGSGELPATVTGVAGSARSSTSVSLSWSAAADAVSYKILRDGVQIAVVSEGTSFIDTGLNPSTDYVYQVLASNQAGDAQASAPVSLRTRDWIDDNPLALLVLTPAASVTSGDSVFRFSGQAGAGLTNGITWSNAASGQTGFFTRVRDWTNELSLVPGTNIVTFRSAYELYRTNTVGWDAPGASAYLGGWSSGMNAGNGFGAWSLGTTGSAGHFIAFAGINTNITPAYGFGLWANNGGVATAQRDFTVPLQLRSRFTVFVENNWITENSASSVGFALTDGDNKSRFSFSYTGGQANYRINDASPNRDTGIAWSDTGFTVTFQLTGADTYNLTIGSNSFSGTLAEGGQISRLVASNNNAGQGEAYNLYLGDMSLESVADLSGVAEAVAPQVFWAIPKTDGLPDAWWEAHGIPAASRLADGDYDLDGLNNAMEYFMALDPGADDAAAAVAQQVTADEVVFDYRRSKSLNGVSGTVTWTSALGDAAVWSTDSVTDVLLSEDEVHEWRRAWVPWPQDQGQLFLRIDLTIE